MHAEGLRLKKATRTKSSAKSVDTILRFQTWKLFLPWLCLKSPSVNITNRIGDGGWPWQRWRPTGNVFVPRMWRRLSLWSYKDYMALSKGSGSSYSGNVPHRTSRRTREIHTQPTCQGKKLVHCSTARMESGSLLLNLKSDHPSEPPFPHPEMNFNGEAGQCDTPVTRATSLVWTCLNCPSTWHNTEEEWQPEPKLTEVSSPESSAAAWSWKNMSVRSISSSKCSFHCSTIYSVI